MVTRITIHSEPYSIEVETDRLKIVSATENHLPDLIALYGDLTVNRLVGAGATLNAEQVAAKVQRWITRWSEHNPFSGYVVVDKASGEFIGQIILKWVKKSDPQLAEIGYLFVERHWNKKYASECTGAVLNHLLPRLKRDGLPITTVIATARVDNGASNAVLRKFMQYDGNRPRYGAPREWYLFNP